jgi:hypothetical protein
MDTIIMDLRDRGDTNEVLTPNKSHYVPPVPYISIATLKT